VIAKTQVRSQIEGQNAQREKKIAQLNEFIARLRPERGRGQVQSRARKSKRLQVTNWRNRTFSVRTEVRAEAAVGKQFLRSKASRKRTARKLIPVHGERDPREKIALMGAMARARPPW